MLDQVTGTLICIVTALEDGTAYCKVEDVEKDYDTERSIDAEYWIGAEMQLHSEYCGQTDKQFEKTHAIGRRVRVAINVQPILGRPKKALE